VEQAAELVSHIAAASNEQAIGFGQINQGISMVSAVIQSNSAIAEESAASSEELSGQAQMLDEQIGIFKLGAPQEVKAKASVDAEPVTLS